MSTEDLEPLLPDDRVGKIAELLLVAYPALGAEAEVFTFVVPEQRIEDRNSKPVPHEPGCPRGANCGCGPYTVPEQAVFAIRTPHPRATFDSFYRGKTLMSNAGMLRQVWDREETARRHYVSPREDPAWAPFDITAREHIRKTASLKALI